MVDTSHRITGLADKPVASEDILFLTHHLLAAPVGFGGELPVELLLHRNVFLRESIFRYWQREFLKLLGNIAAAPTRSAQARRLAGHMLAERQWRALHAAVGDAAASDHPDLLRMLLDGIEWFHPDESPSLRYAVDTRKWVSCLTVNGLEFLSRDVFAFDDDTLAAILIHRRISQDFAAGTVERVTEPGTSADRKKQAAVVQRLGRTMDGLRRALVEGGDLSKAISAAIAIVGARPTVRPVRSFGGVHAAVERARA